MSTIIQTKWAKPMHTSTRITVRNQFIAYHRWIDAPDHCAFLRNWHRHVFQVKFSVQVGHDNRAVEFFDLQRDVQEVLDGLFVNKHLEFSCEQMAEMVITDLKDEHDVLECTVGEDGENEATVTVIKE